MRHITSIIRLRVHVLRVDQMVRLIGFLLILASFDSSSKEIEESPLHRYKQLGYKIVEVEGALLGDQLVIEYFHARLATFVSNLQRFSENAHYQTVLEQNLPSLRDHNEVHDFVTYMVRMKEAVQSEAQVSKRKLYCRNMTQPQTLQRLNLLATESYKQHDRIALSHYMRLVLDWDVEVVRDVEKFMLSSTKDTSVGRYDDLEHVLKERNISLAEYVREHCEG